MQLRTIVWRELWERPTALATSLLAILLGVAALVAMRHVTVFSEREVARQLNMLGANVLVLPKSATLQDYYSADLNGETLPEEHASQILLAGLTGVEKLSPKLCLSVQYEGRPVTLTGILPQSEFHAKTAWQAATMFSSNKHVGCKKAACEPTPESFAAEALASQRTIENLQDHEAVVGADVAAAFAIEPGASLELLGGEFEVLAVLPPTGTIDDSRIFAHLHTVQRLAKTGEVVSAIEVFGCCEDVAGQLVPQIGQLLPDSKVVTISQVVQTQVGVNGLMARASLLVLVVLVLVGGASVLGTISSNVRERRREIGTLMALGATPGLVSRLFVMKATWLGLAGGVGGSMLGTALAVGLGSRWAGVAVTPLPQVGALACGAALAVTLAAAYWPARQAARLDPCASFREVETMIRLEDVTKLYAHRGRRVMAFQCASLEIGAGEYVAMVGPSGSGKTTLLSLLGGMLSPTTGRVWLGETSLYDVPVKRRARLRGEQIGFVFQTFNLVPYLTAAENVQVPLYLAGLPGQQQRARAASLLERLGLSDRMDHKPSELSVGQQQRVALARTLANNPQVILADEPTGNLDPESRQRVLDFLDELSREHHTIVMVTHDAAAADRAQRTLALSEGAVTPVACQVPRRAA